MSFTSQDDKLLKLLMGGLPTRLKRRAGLDNSFKKNIIFGPVLLVLQVKRAGSGTNVIPVCKPVCLLI